jgi:hypothetical protein
VIRSWRGRSGAGLCGDVDTSLDGVVMVDCLCRTCGRVMVRKSPLRLFLVGLVLAASPAVAVFLPYLWAPTIMLVLTGVYLMIWASLGRAYWCRECKKFSLLPQ